MVMADDYGSMRIAEDDLRAHIYELIDEEQARLEHLLVNEHGALCLRCYDEDDREQVRCQTRPRSICDGEDRTVKERLDLIVFLRRDIKVITPFFDLDTQAAEGFGDNT